MCHAVLFQWKKNNFTIPESYFTIYKVSRHLIKIYYQRWLTQNLVDICRIDRGYKNITMIIIVTEVIQWFLLTNRKEGISLCYNISGVFYVILCYL